ncbi:ribonuclease h family protein [Colletotrichum sojae]|uniref:Ribonuclease h family protein n=1 Tax=Colletotrichum sojae TaxID=2175907 RepID=A0A8H6MIH2_9PEZI|nr:ribonuclease h family protein [Colletotrichum sojae]
MSTSTDKAGGELSLSKLLATLTTVLHEPTYVFITLPDTAPLPPLPEIHMLFRETEGITLITTLDVAVAHGYEYQYECKKITLNVHSSLEAVGFMAAVATRLAKNGISVNPVSAYFHDHIFVPVGKEDVTVRLLEELAKENGN